MTPEDVPELEQLLQRRFPHSDVRVIPNCHTLMVVAGGIRLQTPKTLDYRALSVAEWRHRVVEALAPKLTGEP